MSVLPLRPRVLVVDDNAGLVDNLTEILDDAGYDVRSASRCEQALREARANGFDVALVDVRLPDGDGTTLAPRLKEVSPGGEIVMLTGFATVETAAAAVRAGACAYLLKPAATPELLLTIEQAMRQVRLQAEKRELSRRAQVAEKLAAVGTLTAGLSHEIRNPLNAAGIQLTVLERRIHRVPEDLQPMLLEPLALVRDEIRRLEHILQDFLQFARPREFIARPVSLAALLGKVCDLLGGDAEQRGVKLERDFAGAPEARGDHEQLQQVMMNLGLNALDAAGPGGQVRIAARAVGDRVAVSVDDSGTGVPLDMRGRIFEPFFTTKAAGSGLGLPIVHAIITQHGGTVEVKTSDLGGARFEVMLNRA